MSQPVRTVRFGLMCAEERLGSAFAASVDELLKIDGVELALLITDVSAPARRSLWTTLARILSLRGNLWAIFQWLLRPQRLSCHRPRDMSAVLARVPRIRCYPEDVEQIRGHGLDFILRFSGGILRGDILTAARYGVWSFHYGDESGSPPAFRELCDGAPTTGAILQRLVDRAGAGIVLQRCHIQSRRWSYAANLNAIVWAAAYMPARVCRDILLGRAAYLEAAPSATPAPVSRAPSDLEMVRFLLRTWAAWVKRQVEGILFVEHWNVGVIQAPVEGFLDPDFRPEIRWLADAGAKTFRADPFIRRSGASETRLLAEEFDYASDRGVIVEMALDETGAATSSRRVAIDNGAHMSYPYLIEHRGHLYCVPESWQTRSVSLYAFDDRQRQWRFVVPIIKDFPAVDPTIVQHDGLWWLWCTNAEDEPDSKLFVWYALDLVGSWRPHPGNPVKVDVRSSRPAGRPFRFDGELYRPAQDCSRAYGGGITINRVARLSLVEFHEEPVAHIEPWDRRYRVGIHTLTGDGSLTVVDGNRMVMAPDPFGRLAHKLGRLARACRSGAAVGAGGTGA